MTRPILERFIAAHGIIDSPIMLHRYPITLERWRDGQDEIPKAVANWLEGWAASRESAVTISNVATHVEWPASDEATTLASIHIPAGSMGVDDLSPPIPGWHLRYSPEQLARLQSMASSKGIEPDEQTAAEL
jgi:hypothetical protein